MKSAASALPALAAVGLALLLAPRSARADDAACFRAAVEGQQLERSGKLIAARERFVACAQRSCDAAAVVDKCTGWLRGVEAALPSLTIAVKDEAGHDRIADRARIDDADASAALSGRAIDIDPGVHKVSVDVGGVTLVESVVMLQGQKLRAVVFQPSQVPRATREAGSSDASRSRALLGGAIAAGSVAVLSGILVGYFGATGLSARSQYGCATGCSPDHFQSVHQDFVAADASLGVALGTAAIATVLLVVRAATSNDAPVAAQVTGLLHAASPARLGFSF